MLGDVVPHLLDPAFVKAALAAVNGPTQISHARDAIELGADSAEIAARALQAALITGRAGDTSDKFASQTTLLVEYHGIATYSNYIMTGTSERWQNYAARTLEVWQQVASSEQSWRQRSGRGEGCSDYQFGDFSRSMWVAAHNRKPQNSPGAPSIADAVVLGPAYVPAAVGAAKEAAVLAGLGALVFTAWSYFMSGPEESEGRQDSTKPIKQHGEESSS